MNSFQNRLKQILNERNIKQSELSNGTGIDKGAISSYLNGKYMPKQNNITLIANYLNISPDYLLGITNDKNDFEHEHTLNEIVYKQLQSLVDIDEYHKFDEKLFNFMEAVKNGSFPVMEGSIDAIANLFDTNTLYLLGKSDDWYSEDPMDDNFKNRIKTRTTELLKNPDRLVEEYNKRKHNEYQNTLVNRAYNTLADLGIEKIMDKDIKTIETDTLISYYDIIIRYIKDTTKMVDFDKLIKEKINLHKKSINNVTKYEYTTYYFDFLSLKDANTIDDISTPKQLENYVALTLRRLNYKLSVVSKSNSSNAVFPLDFHAFKGNNEYYIECKYLNNSSKIYSNIKKWSLIFEKINTKKEVIKVLVTNIPIPNNDKMICKKYFDELWDYYYFKELEKQLKTDKNKED